MIFFSSVAGLMGHRNHGPYAATKGAINQLMKVMAHEYAEHGVTVNAVAPGYMDTELDARPTSTQDPGRREALEALIPSRRFGRLAEVADPGAVPGLAAGELHHRSDPVHRRRPHGRVSVRTANGDSHVDSRART